jgi:hypothetical protein
VGRFRYLQQVTAQYSCFLPILLALLHGVRAPRGKDGRLVRILSLVVLGMALGLVPQSGWAQVFVYTTFMDGPSENPPNPSFGTGTASLTFDLGGVTPTMLVEADFTGLTSTTTIAHVHCCVNPPGTTIPATTTPTFPGFPVGVTSGSYSQLFDMSLASSYNNNFLLGSTPAQKLTAFLAGLDAGQAYFNVHTSTSGGGEIRGFLQFIPEPSSFALCAVGAIGLLARRRR